MATSSSLYVLVNRMEVNEKTYFKKYAFKKKNKNQTMVFDLFDIIDKSGYDPRLSVDKIELKIKSKFLKKGYTQFIRIKSYLLDLLIKSLTQHGLQNGAENRIWNLFLSAEMLLQKSMYELAYSQLLKAREIANEYHCTYLLPKIQMKILRISHNAKKDDAHTHKSNLALSSLYQNNLAHLIEIAGQNAAMQHSIRQGVRYQANTSVNKMVNNPLVINAPKFGFYSELTALDMSYFYALQQVDYEGIHGALKGFIELYERHPKMMEIHEYNWMSCNLNFLDACLRLNHFEEYEQYHTKFKTYTFKKHQAIKFGEFKILDTELNYCMGLNKLNMLLNIESAYQKFRANNRNFSLPAYFISFESKLSILFFLANESSKMVYWANRILNNKAAYAETYKAKTWLQLLCSTADDGEWTLLESQCRSFKTFINQENINSPLLSICMQLFSQLCQLELLKHKDAFKEFKHLLIKLDEDEKKLLQWFDIVLWVNSKINNTTFNQEWVKKNLSDVANSYVKKQKNN